MAFQNVTRSLNSLHSSRISPVLQGLRLRKISTFTQLYWKSIIYAYVPERIKIGTEAVFFSLIPRGHAKCDNFIKLGTYAITACVLDIHLSH